MTKNDTQVLVNENMSILVKELSGFSSEAGVRELIARQKIDVNQTDQRGNSLLYLVACSNNIIATKCLISLGADVNSTNDSGFAAFTHLIIFDRDKEIIKAFLEAGVDLGAKGNLPTPLDVAYRKRCHDIVNLIENNIEKRNRGLSLDQKNSRTSSQEGLDLENSYASSQEELDNKSLQSPLYSPYEAMQTPYFKPYSNKGNYQTQALQPLMTSPLNIKSKKEGHMSTIPSEQTPVYTSNITNNISIYRPPRTSPQTISDGYQALEDEKGIKKEEGHKKSSCCNIL